MIMYFMVRSTCWAGSHAMIQVNYFMTVDIIKIYIIKFLEILEMC